MEDIGQIWLNSIMNSMKTAFGQCTSVLLKKILSSAASNVANIESSSKWYNINEKGRLRKELENGSITDESSDDEYKSYKKIFSPYAGILEEGGFTSINNRVAYKLYQIYKDNRNSTKAAYKNAFRYAYGHLGGKFEHKAHPYLTPAIEGLDDNEILEVIGKKIEAEINSNINDFEVTID